MPGSIWHRELQYTVQYKVQYEVHPMGYMPEVHTKAAYSREDVIIAIKHNNLPQLTPPCMLVATGFSFFERGFLSTRCTGPDPPTDTKAHVHTHTYTWLRTHRTRHTAALTHAHKY